MTSAAPFQLGLHPPVPGAIKLRLATYLDFRMLPTPPVEFGHYDLIDNWEMMGNDQWGCCAFAGGVHQCMLWTTEGGNPAPFSTQSTLTNYSAVTGFNLNAGPSGDNPTDQGTAISDLANYWLQTGLVDDKGNHHKVVAVADLNPGDLRELWLATYLFQSVGLGFQMPASAMQQTQAGQPWDIVDDDGGIQGGHYVPAVGRVDANTGVLITWGQKQLFTSNFYRRYNNQGIVALSEEMLVEMKSIDGFDDQLLKADLKAF